VLVAFEVTLRGFFGLWGIREKLSRASIASAAAARRISIAQTNDRD
jgi:hypothetical protein